MARTTNVVTTIFEGIDRTSDDIEKIRNQLGRMEDEQTKFFRLTKGIGVAAIAWQTLSASVGDANQRLTEYSEEFQKLNPEADRFLQNQADLSRNMEELGAAIAEKVLPVANAFLGFLVDATEAAMDLGEELKKTFVNNPWIRAARHFLGMGQPETPGGVGGTPTFPAGTGQPYATGTSVNIAEGWKEFMDNTTDWIYIIEDRFPQATQAWLDTLNPGLEVSNEQLKMAKLTSEELRIQLKNVAVEGSTEIWGSLIPALDAVIDRLHSAGGAGNFLLDVFRGAAFGFITGGPAGAAVGAGIAVMNQVAQPRPETPPRSEWQQEPATPIWGGSGVYNRRVPNS